MKNYIWIEPHKNTQEWNPRQVRIIALDGTDVGWLQAIRQDDELFVAQMFVDGLFQRRGIGTEMKRLTILVFDRDQKFGFEVSAAVKATRMIPKRTSFRSPWQNGIAVRWVGSCRTRPAGPHCCVE